MNRTRPPATRRRPGWPGEVGPDEVGPDEVGPDEVADLIERVAVTDRCLATVMDWIGGRRDPVCAETVVRLEPVLARGREGARVRSPLAALTPGLPPAGSALSAPRRTERRTALRVLREALQAVAP